jgi:hypothetical protein
MTALRAISIMGRFWWVPWLGFWVIALALWVWCMFLIPPSPLYEYRLVTPAEAMRLVNDEGWEVSQRVRMTDQAVYIYHRR